MVWIAAVFLAWIAAFGLCKVAFQRGRLHTPWHRDVAALALLALAALGFFWRIAAGQDWMPADGGDLASFLYPTYRFAAATLQQGAWPLWNAHLYGGAPHVGDIQAGFLYPPNLLLFLLRPAFGYATLQWLSIAHIWFAGAGMYFLVARGTGLQRVAAIAAGLAFMFADPFLLHFGNLNYIAVVSWLPWIFWAYAGALKFRQTGSDRESSQERARLGLAAVAGVLLAIATLAGHAQGTVLIVLALATYTGLWLWMRRDDLAARRRFFRALAALGLCLLVAVLLAAPVLLPAAQLAGHTARVGWSYQETAGYSLAPAQWIGWVIPGFFGRGPQFHWGAWPRVEVGYIGIFTLILAGLALALRRDRRTWTWFGLGVASFVLSLGIYAIVHGWLTQLPGLGWLRAPARFVLVTDFAIAILAAIGLDAALAPLQEAARAPFEGVYRLVALTTAAVFAIVVPLAYLALLIVQGRDDALVLRVSIILIAVLAFAGLLAGSLFWLAARRGEWFRPLTLGWLAVGLIYLDLAASGAYQDLGGQDPSVSFEQPSIAAFLNAQSGPFRIDARTEIDDLWQPDTALTYGWDDVGGLANPMMLADAQRYWDSLGSRASLLYDLLNARYVIARKDVLLDWGKFDLVYDGDPDLNVYENRQVLPRAFFVRQVVAAPDHEAAWQTIHAPGFDPNAQAVVEGAAPPAGGVGKVTSLVAQPNRLTLGVETDGDAVLVISQMWYPGWRAWVDGRPIGAPLRADYAFQALSVPAGAHQVELRFQPAAWRAGWGLAVVAALLLLAWAAVAAFRRGKRRAALPPGAMEEQTAA